MAITQDLNVEPYYDDFDDSKGYHRLLFRPGFAVQARELTQVQTILQNQIEKFGKHIFKEGSMVIGGQTLYDNETAYYLKIEDTDADSNVVDVEDFDGLYIKKQGSTDVRAYVIAKESTTANGKVLVVKYLSAAKFTDGDLIEDENGELFAQMKSSSSTGLTSIISIEDGVFFVNGFFAKVNRQTLILDAFGTSPSYRVGLEIADSIVDENTDTSLLDPALNASNFQAPGATRLKLELTLSKRSLSSLDDSKFVNLVKIENGSIREVVTYPQYSVLEDTLARRTFDESGDYTVRPFRVSFTDDYITEQSNSYNIIIGPGKAYVKGYEFETLSPTTIVSPRARDYVNVSNYGITVNYQNYVDVTKLSGTIDLKELATINVHCVPVASINTTSTATISSTDIGSVRIRALDYQYGANTSSNDDAVYRAYIFDTNILTRTANSTSGSSNTIVLDTNASSVDDAYKGVKIRITARNGVAQTESRIITAYNGTTKTATVDTNWQYANPDVNTTFSLDYEFKDAESFVRTSGTTILTEMNIASDSKTSSLIDAYEPAFISEQNYNNLLMPFPNFAIKEGSIQNTEYFGRRMVSDAFNAGGILDFTTASGVTAAVTGSISATDAIDNFFVVLTTDGDVLTSNTVVNFLDPNNTVSVVTASNTSTITVTVPGAENASALVYFKAKLPYADSLGGIRKTKVLNEANTSVVSTTGSDTIVSGNVFQFAAETDQPGLQLNISNLYTSAMKDSSQTQSLYMADVISLAAVFDFGANTATTANLAYAVDITDSYTLVDGQNDNYYDHSAIRLNSGSAGPTGNVVIFADYYSHTGYGYFNIDSYIDGGTAYNDIPTYTSPNSGKIYYLRDVIDFRPRRKDGSSGLTGLFAETILGTSGTQFETDFSYYLPRIDKICVTKDKKFEIIQGVSSLRPVPPKDRDDAMTIYMLVLPAYISNTEEVRARFIENKRYTMRDIGEIEQRVQNLEYFSNLNLLEKTASDEQFIDDSTGLPRVKTGIVADPFTSFKIADVLNEDYNASIDMIKGEIRPSFDTENFKFEVGATSSNVSVNGNIITVEYTNTSFITQPMTSNTVSINPFNAPAPSGTTLTDTVDNEYPDVEQPPEVVDNVENKCDHWHACVLRYRWNWNYPWKNYWWNFPHYHVYIGRHKYNWLEHKSFLLARGYKYPRLRWNCYSHEWGWWYWKINKYPKYSLLPVPAAYQISNSAIPVSSSYAKNYLDVNQNGVIDSNDLNYINKYWNVF
jgi:hypothetical protein